MNQSGTNTGRQEELLREAVSRQLTLTLNCKNGHGWMASSSTFLGLEPGSGDIIVAYPTGPASMQPEIVAGQLVGISFRRAHRACVFETSVVGRCGYSAGRSDDLPALRLLWPTSIFELQRRLYYRTPVPESVHMPAQVRLADDQDSQGNADSCRGKILNISADGLSLLLKEEDNPRWQSETPVVCSFAATEGEDKLDLYGQIRFLTELPGREVQMGVQFIGLETAGETRTTLNRVVELTRNFQEIERKRLGV